MIQLTDPITVLRGVGPKKEEALSKLNIRSIDDLIRYLPREYQDRTEVTPIAQLRPGQQTTVIAAVERVVQNYYRAGRGQMLRVYVSDET